MADERKYYVLCQNNCKFESMTKEQILSAITQAVNNGTIENVDAGFITKIKDLNTRGLLSFWVGTTAEYNALQTKEENCFYILTDDTTADGINEMVLDHEEKLNAVDDFVIEQGTVKPSSLSIFTWNYKKWASGLYEIWLKYSTEASNIARPWGALYISGTSNETDSFAVELPRDLASVEYANITVEKVGHVIWAVPNGIDTSGNYYLYYVVTTSPKTDFAFDVMVSIKGKWK